MAEAILAELNADGVFVPVDEVDRRAVGNLTAGGIYKLTITLPKNLKNPTEEQRRAAQNRLYWMWLTDIEKTTVNTFAGHTQKEWHDRFKGLYLVKIYIRDRDDYAELWATLADLKQVGCERESRGIWRFIRNQTSTTLATVSQFAEYLTQINRWCLMRGIWLRTDAELYALAMVEGYA